MVRPDSILLGDLKMYIEEVIKMQVSNILNKLQYTQAGQQVNGYTRQLKRNEPSDISTIFSVN